MQPRPTADLPPRQPLDAVHPTHLRPQLHADQSLLLADRNRSDGGQRPAGHLRPRAQVAYFSTGAGGTFFSRRPHLPAAAQRSEHGAAAAPVPPASTERRPDSSPDSESRPSAPSPAACRSAPRRSCRAATPRPCASSGSPRRDAALAPGRAQLALDLAAVGQPVLRVPDGAAGAVDAKDVTAGSSNRGRHATNATRFLGHVRDI